MYSSSSLNFNVIHIAREYLVSRDFELVPTIDGPISGSVVFLLVGNRLWDGIIYSEE